MYFSSRPIRFGVSLSHREREDKENSKPKEVKTVTVADDDDSDSEEGPVLYKDDDNDKCDKSSKYYIVNLILTVA